MNTLQTVYGQLLYVYGSGGGEGYKGQVSIPKLLGDQQIATVIGEDLNGASVNDDAKLHRGLFQRNGHFVSQHNGNVVFHIKTDVCAEQVKVDHLVCVVLCFKGYIERLALHIQLQRLGKCEVRLGHGVLTENVKLLYGKGVEIVAV